MCKNLRHCCLQSGFPRPAAGLLKHKQSRGSKGVPMGLPVAAVLDEWQELLATPFGAYCNIALDGSVSDVLQKIG